MTEPGRRIIVKTTNVSQENTGQTWLGHPLERSRRHSLECWITAVASSLPDVPAARAARTERLRGQPSSGPTVGIMRRTSLLRFVLAVVFAAIVAMVIQHQRGYLWVDDRPTTTLPLSGNSDLLATTTTRPPG